jgi:Secretion system C-terminal sorting domain
MQSITSILIFFIFLFYTSSALSLTKGDIPLNDSHLPSGTQPEVLIDAADSVIFDLSEATCDGNMITFPILIDSDESVFAIDFAIKYDITKISYDSLIVLKPYVSATINYNPLDSTLRLSSFSGQIIENGVPLFAIRFAKLASNVDSIGFSRVDTYLNGDVCGNKVRSYFSRPAISPAGPLNISTGDSITLNVTALQGFSYLWSTGDTTNSIIIHNDGIFSVTATNPKGCTTSSFITITQGILLPVELISFNAFKSDQDILLEWITASENDNDYFTIERSGNGKDWGVINTIEGSGNSNISIEYKTIDREPLQALNYYRLLQTDYNGSSDYLGRAVTYFGEKQEENTVLVYPNPFRQDLYIILENDAVVQLFDLNNSAVTDRIIVEKDTKTLINCINSFPGVYLLKIESKSGISTAKVCRIP